MIAKRKCALRDGRPGKAQIKQVHPYNSTNFRQAQAKKQQRREIIAEWLALPITLVLLGGVFWGFWILRGVVEHV